MIVSLFNILKYEVFWIYFNQSKSIQYVNLMLVFLIYAISVSCETMRIEVKTLLSLFNMKSIKKSCLSICYCFPIDQRLLHLELDKHMSSVCAGFSKFLSFILQW